MDQSHEDARGRDLSQQRDAGGDASIDDTTNLAGMTGMSNTAPGSGPFGPLGAILPDMTVFGADGAEVGIVREVRGDSFRVNRPAADDVYVPLSAVRDNDGSELRLAVATTDIDAMGWDAPAW
jgi:hypothetical protein